jgi:hypothetical protein
VASASPWDDPSYYWVVICKNKRFHHHANQWAGHKIVLGETDAITPLPEIGRSVQVQCDECGQEYSYKPKEVLRLELQHPEFVTHPLFSEQQTRYESIEPRSPPPTALHSAARLRELAKSALHSAARLRELTKSLLTSAVRSLRRQRARGNENP